MTKNFVFLIFLVNISLLMGQNSNPATCQDLNTNCARWSSLGHCIIGFPENYSPWMMLNCAQTCGTCEIFLSASTNRTALTGQCNDYDTSACAAKQAAGKCDLFTYNGSQQLNLTPDENSFILENCALTCKRCPRD